MLEHRIEGCGCVDYAVTTEVIKEVDTLADNLKKSILEAKDEIKITGTVEFALQYLFLYKFPLFHLLIILLTILHICILIKSSRCNFRTYQKQKVQILHFHLDSKVQK